MQPTTLLNAMQILAGHTGKSVNLHREWLRQQVNMIRRAAWKQEATRLLYFKDSGCECVECHFDDCVRCCGQYRGITLPQNVAGLHYLSVNGVTVDMQNLSLSNGGGCCHVSACGCLKAETLVERQPLKRALPKGYRGRLKFKVLVPADKWDTNHEKLVGVRYVDWNGTIQREDLRMSLAGVLTTYSVAKLLEATFADRCGWIDVQTEEGYSLGSYHPAIHSPSHVRIKITGIGRCDQVHWEGLTEPHDVYFDTDQVEWSNPLDWMNQYQFLNLHFKTDRTNSEQAAYVAAGQLAAAGAQSELAANQNIPAGTLRPQGIQSMRNRIRFLQTPFPIRRHPWTYR